MSKSGKKMCDHASLASSCFICRNNHPFELPEDLYSRFTHGEVVLFVGAGVSTENPAVFPYTLYEDVCGEINVDPSKGLRFPDVMSRYCAQTNGRAKLLRRIRDRFDYIRSFPGLYRQATRFHCELSTLSFVEEIVTTNWDPYFEHECGATPFVNADDFTFWNVPGRKVFKIHGSVDSYGSIIATREDYNACQERLKNGLLGSKLRILLGTKTVVYVGFSFRDEDFEQLHSNLIQEMRGLMPQAYIVTLDRSSDARFREKGLSPIYTDASFFIADVKRRLVADKQLVGDERFDGVESFLNKLTKVHFRVAGIDAKKYPEVVYGLSYQDGTIQALQRILVLRNTGYYSHACNVRNACHLYAERIGPEKRRLGAYHDEAYVEGYTDGLTFFLADVNFRRQIPMYFAFGEKMLIRNFNEYLRTLKRASRTSPRRHKFAKRLVAKMNAGNGVVFEHTPFLL